LYLLAQGADPNLANSDGVAPLSLATRAGVDNSSGRLRDGYPELIDTLIAKGANVNAQDRTGTTALMEAAANGDADTVRLLLAHGANPLLRNAGGETAFDIAAKNRRGAAVTAFIEKGYPLTTRQRLKYYFARFAYGLARFFPLLFLSSIAAIYFYSKWELKKPVPEKRAAGGGDDLPRLAPLKCDNCGGGIPLKLEGMHCPYCSTPVRTQPFFRPLLFVTVCAFRCGRAPSVFALLRLLFERRAETLARDSRNR
ncbi:MAG: ankyrin repeat domain-containing protein, partial [Acidobacteria bacterium]|nr:ankyrin repeat domain-containing protein [Acidobacteriota bacterium]